jgi:2-haloacid dehalogenase
VRRLKPAAEVYHMAARELGVEPGAIRLVAAHSWDVAGAMHAGCAAAFVARPGMVLDPLFKPPDIIGKDLVAVSERILKTDRSLSVQ